MPNPARRRESEAARDEPMVLMPAAITTNMRKAGERVGMSLTICEVPYLDRLYKALIEAWRKEQEDDE